MESIKTRFFGRKTLIQEIVQGVLAPSQPLDFSLVGPRMVGKTRLLHHLASEEGPLHGPDPFSWRPERFRDGHNVIVVFYNCRWPEAQVNLLKFIHQGLRMELEPAKNLGLDWSQIENLGSPGQQIVQIARQLDQQQIRLVLLMDNFDQVLLNERVTPDMVNELRPLTNDLGMVVATEHPLHDLDQTLAASPLFNLMHQHFVGLLEPDAAQEWIEAYGQRIPWTPQVGRALQEIAGGHPFMLARINDILLEIQPLLSANDQLEIEHLPLIKLRLAEHGRPLFTMIWRKLNDPRGKTALSLVEQLIAAPIAIDQIPSEQWAAFNWLINYAVVAYDGNTYHLFSPLLQEFLADQMGLEQKSLPIWSATAAIGTASPGPPDIFKSLPPKEAELLRYFQAHSHTVVSIEQLLTDVWNQPEASPRRVQEAIRRLRNSLNKHPARIGVIENERGVGYRYVPLDSLDETVGD